MINGFDKFRIVYGETVYEPSGWSSYNPEIDNQNIERRSIITKKDNVRVSWTYYNSTAKVKNISAEDIAFFRTISGKEVRLYPNIDVPGISYYCSVTKAEVKYEDGKSWKPYVDLSFAGVFNVEILTTLTAKSIAIIAMNGSEYLQRGNDVLILWDGDNFTDAVKIELYKDGVLDSVITATTDNDGSFAWTIPSDQEVGTDYKLKISEISDLYVFDESDDDFSIAYDGYYETLAWQNSTIPLKNNILFGDTYSVCFDFDNNGYTTDLKTLIKSQGSTNHFYLYPNVYHNGRVYVELSATCNCYSSVSKITDTGFTKVCIVFNRTANTAKFYFNGVYDTGSTVSGTIPTLDYTSMSILGATGGSWKFRNIVFTSHEMTATEIAHYANNNISAIANKTLWLPCNEANTYQMPYGDFNGTNNYINMGFKPADITSTKPFEIVFKHETPITEKRVYSVYDSASHLFALKLQTNGSVQIISGNDVTGFTLNLATIGAYANGWLKLKYEYWLDGATPKFNISLWGLNADYTYTQISTTVVYTIVTFPNYNIYLGVYNNTGSLSTYWAVQIAYIKGNGQEWYIRPATSTTIKGSLGTSLTVNGTLTNFWQTYYANIYQMPYGNFNGTDNYINMGFKPADITSTKPFEVVFKHQLAMRIFGCKDVSLSDYFQVYNLVNGDVKIVYSDALTSDFTIAQIGSYSQQWLKVKVENNGSGSFLISLWGLNSDNTFTQISTTRTVTIGNLPNLNFYLGARNDSGTPYYLYGASQIAYIKGNGQEWYLRPYTSSSIRGSLGTSLTVNGTLTSFWVNDEPYTDVTQDISGNANNGTPTAIIPANFFNQS